MANLTRPRFEEAWAEAIPMASAGIFLGAVKVTVVVVSPWDQGTCITGNNGRPLLG